MHRSQCHHAWEPSQEWENRPSAGLTTMETVFRDHLDRGTVPFEVRLENFTKLTQAQRLLLNRSHDEARRACFVELIRVVS